MAGTDTVRGITFQHALALLAAHEVLTDPTAPYLRVEGSDDIVDIEILNEDKELVVGRQAKVRQNPYTWGKAELVKIFKRWLTISTEHARFEIVTDGRLGPTGEEVKLALKDAAEGNLGPAAQLFDLPATSNIRHRLRYVTIVDRSPSGEEIFAEAEYLVSTLLPAPVTAAEAADASRDATNSLYRFLLETAGKPNEVDRLITRSQLAQVIGVNVNELPVGSWRESDKRGYVKAAKEASHSDFALVPLDLREVDDTPLALSLVDINSSRARSDSPVSATDIAQYRRCILAGETGCGKSRMLERLRRELAGEGVALVIGRAELYVDGHLSLLVAGGASEVTNRSVSARAGRDILADPETIVAIDGYSELPISKRDVLRQEIAVLASSQPKLHCRILLAGRDLSILRSAIADSQRAAQLAIAPLSSQSQIEIVKRLIGRHDADDAESNRIVREIDNAIGSGAKNPLVFRMAASLTIQGYSFSTRAEVYSQFLDAFAARSDYDSIDILTAIAGVAFSTLLDGQRRYSDQFGWRSALREAIRPIADIVGPRFDPAGADSDLRRIGIVKTFGNSGTIAPLHDSFADYLSATAIARGLARLPEVLSSADEQRTLFIAEISGVTEELAVSLLRHLPFLALRVALYDRRTFSEASTAELSRYFNIIMPGEPSLGFDFFSDESGRIFAVRSSQSTGQWLSADDGLKTMRRHGGLQISGGPLSALSQIWSHKVRSRLIAEQSGGAYYRHGSAESDAEQLRSHMAKAEANVMQFIQESFFGIARSTLLDVLRPIGREIKIRRSVTDQAIVPARSIRSRRAAVTTVTVLDDNSFDSLAGLDEAENWSSSSVDSLLTKSPSTVATERIVAGLKRLSIEGWIEARERRQGWGRS